MANLNSSFGLERSFIWIYIYFDKIIKNMAATAAGDNFEVDFVFTIAEGHGNYSSREAQVPSVLEMLNIPYSGSNPQCLAICLDKPLAKKLVRLAGIATVLSLMSGFRSVSLPGS